MAFISQHCNTPAPLPALLDVNEDISLYFENDCDNLNDDVKDFLLAAAEHTKAAPVGLHDNDTILEMKINFVFVFVSSFVYFLATELIECCFSL